jgi:hypothetical protein
MLTNAQPKETDASTDITPEQILDVIKDYLQTALEKNIIKLASSGRGKHRTDSSITEESIGNSLRGFAEGHPLFTQLGLSFEMATNGNWYDFLIRSADDSIWLPINLKVSSLEGNDDLSSKDGVFYALTGIRPTTGMTRNWDLFCQNLAIHVKRNNCLADYYYLVVQKTSPGKSVGKVFWTSLLRLQRVTPNGCNPPFQCKWKENTERAAWGRQQAVDNLINVLGETFVQRAKAFDSFRTHLVPTFSGGLKTRWFGDCLCPV